MSNTIQIPPPLRSLTEGQSEIVIEGDCQDILALFEKIEEKHPGFLGRVCEVTNERVPYPPPTRGFRLVPKCELRRFVNVYIDGEDIRFNDGLATRVYSGQEVSIIPAIAGG